MKRPTPYDALTAELGLFQDHFDEPPRFWCIEPEPGKVLVYLATDTAAKRPLLKMGDTWLTTYLVPTGAGIWRSADRQYETKLGRGQVEIKTKNGRRQVTKTGVCEQAYSKELVLIAIEILDWCYYQFRPETKTTENQKTRG